MPALVIRVGENERPPSLYAQAATTLPVDISDAPYAMVGFGAASGSGFAGAGRVHPARPFILSSFQSRRKPEGHWGPRSVAVLHYTIGS
jgi:hypothetical protein